jgi:hypothetical protein
MTAKGIPSPRGPPNDDDRADSLAMPDAPVSVLRIHHADYRQQSLTA